jgi:hypothetical protein
MLIGMVEVERIPLPMMKPNISPTLEGDLSVGIITNEMGMGMLGILVEKKGHRRYPPNRGTYKNEHRWCRSNISQGW